MYTVPMGRSLAMALARLCADRENRWQAQRKRRNVGADCLALDGKPSLGKLAHRIFGRATAPERGEVRGQPGTSAGLAPMKSQGVVFHAVLTQWVSSA